MEYATPAPAPWGASWEEVWTAYRAALTSYNRLHDRLDDEPDKDDAIRVFVGEDEIIFRWTDEES